MRPPRAGREAVVVGAGAGPVASATLVTRTAAVLNTGCFETGSHSVRVSSLAARWRCPGSRPVGSSWSQDP
ncbi:hypothetical protein ABL57_11010 [Kocuria sp. SM24M-10]|nr:hypothetical protein ABL57_11010 [Kocuria sp. SM24M-10]